MKKFFEHLSYAIYARGMKLTPKHMKLLYEEWNDWNLNHFGYMSYKKFEKKIFEIFDNFEN